VEKEIPKNLAFLFDDVHYRGSTFDVIGQVVADQLRASGVLGDLQPATYILSADGLDPAVRKDDIIQ